MRNSVLWNTSIAVDRVQHLPHQIEHRTQSIISGNWVDATASKRQKNVNAVDGLSPREWAANSSSYQLADRSMPVDLHTWPNCGHDDRLSCYLTIWHRVFTYVHSAQCTHTHLMIRRKCSGQPSIQCPFDVRCARIKCAAQTKWK